MNIPFNRPHTFREEYQNIMRVIEDGGLSGNGFYTQKCHQFFKDYYDIDHCLLTNSCTAALEMSAILLNIEPGDEVIIPAYGYMSTANAFLMKGAKLVFVDSQKNGPNLDVSLLRDLITDRTKAIVIIHYAGIAVDMDVVMELATEFGVYVVEDAAHCIDAYYKNRPLGTIGHFGAISFHSSKNITSGHGGLLILNDNSFIDRSNIIWQKGTDKTKFDLGHQGYYEWIDIGSSFFPSEITAAYLYGQLIHLEEVTKKRLSLWNHYMECLQEKKWFGLPQVPQDALHNGHIFYIETENSKERKRIINILKLNNIQAYSHYLSLSESPFCEEKMILQNSRKWQNRLLRLPLYYDLSHNDIDIIMQSLSEY